MDPSEQCLIGFAASGNRDGDVFRHLEFKTSSPKQSWFHLKNALIFRSVWSALSSKRDKKVRT